MKHFYINTCKVTGNTFELGVVKLERDGWPWDDTEPAYFKMNTEYKYDSSYRELQTELRNYIIQETLHRHD